MTAPPTDRLEDLERRVEALERRRRPVDAAMDGATMKGLRLSVGLSLRAFGALLGVSHVTVFDLERGAIVITEERAQEILRAVVASGGVEPVGR